MAKLILFQRPWPMFKLFNLRHKFQSQQVISIKKKLKRKKMTSRLALTPTQMKVISATILKMAKMRENPNPKDKRSV